MLILPSVYAAREGYPSSTGTGRRSSGGPLDIEARIHGCKGGKIDIRPIPPVGGKVTAPGNDIQEQEADFRRRNLERAEAESKDRAAREREQTARRNYCDGLKRDCLALDSSRRIVTDVSAKGERTYMDDDTRSKRLAEIREQLRGCS